MAAVMAMHPHLDRAQEDPVQSSPTLREETETSSLMETAPWRVARRWAATADSSGSRPTVVTHSTRTFPTARGGEGEQDECTGNNGAGEGMAEASFLTEEDGARMLAAVGWPPGNPR